MKVVEIGVEVNEEQLERLESWLERQGIAFYLEPPRVPYRSLAELECDCEGK